MSTERIDAMKRLITEDPEKFAKFMVWLLDRVECLDWDRDQPDIRTHPREVYNVTGGQVRLALQGKLE